MQYWHDSLVLGTAATSDPVSLAEAKKHIRVFTAADDEYIRALITMATDYAQRYQRRQYVHATWKLNLSDFPPEIFVPLSPLSSVTSLKYIDTSDVEQTLVEDTDFVVDKNSEPGRIMPKRGTTGWPDVQDEIYIAVVLTFVAGEGADVDAIEAGPNIGRFRRVQQAIMILCAHWYEQRETEVVASKGVVIEPVPLSVDALLTMDRLWRF